MMKLQKMLFFLFLAIIITNSAFAFDKGDVFCGSEKWTRISGNGIDRIEGITYIEIRILKSNFDSIEMHIFKKRDPLGEYLDFKIEATREDGKYCFRGEDNGKNIIEGYIKNIHDTMEFDLKCVEFNEYGLIYSRLYNEVTVLARK